MPGVRYDVIDIDGNDLAPVDPIPIDLNDFSDIVNTDKPVERMNKGMVR